jgi:hypothetical protein
MKRKNIFKFFVILTYCLPALILSGRGDTISDANTPGSIETVYLEKQSIYNDEAKQHIEPSDAYSLTISKILNNKE